MLSCRHTSNLIVRVDVFLSLRRLDLLRNIFLGLTFSALLLCGVASINSSVYARSEGIAVVVNDGVVTASNVEDRLKLIMVSSGLPNTPEMRSQILPQVISGLVEEKIRIQEAEKDEISVTDGEINKGFETLAQQNNFSAEQFKAILARGGINIKTLHDQIRAQLAWSKLVQSKLRRQVSVSDTDVDAWLARYSNAIGKTEYLVSEIFLPVDDMKDESKLRGLAQSLRRDIAAGKASFFKVAQQFSKAAGAAQGGDLGWVQQGQISEEADQAIAKMSVNTLSQPVRSPAGFHLYLLRDKREITEENLPGRDQVRSIIGMQRLERIARRYLMDLKSSAFINNRMSENSGS
ncbi:MAG: rotamase [Micavibrio sp.]|nr:rotamase [Micavibrio sp.]